MMLIRLDINLDINNLDINRPRGDGWVNQEDASPQSIGLASWVPCAPVADNSMTDIRFSGHCLGDLL